MKNRYLTLLLLTLSFTLWSQDNLQVGDKVTNLTFYTIDGDSISIESLQGKVVYINFFATWCAPCMKELAFMEDDILDKFKNKKFYFIALGRGHTAEQLQTFKSKKGFNFNMACDTDKSLFLRFSEKGIPLNIIIDKDGKIIYKKTGYSSTSFKKIKRTIKHNL